MPKTAKKIVSTHDEASIGMVEFKLRPCDRARVPALGCQPEPFVVFTSFDLSYLFLVFWVVDHVDNHLFHIDNLATADND